MCHQLEMRDEVSDSFVLSLSGPRVIHAINVQRYNSLILGFAGLVSPQIFLRFPCIIRPRRAHLFGSVGVNLAAAGSY